MFFVALSASCAAEIVDVSNTEDSNLTNDDAIALSQEKLEVSNEDSISETNLVNSHDDNLKDYPEDEVLLSSAESYYEDNGEQILSLASDDEDEKLSASEYDSVVSVSSKNYLKATSIVSTTLSVANTHYDKSATYFKVTLQDSTGKSLSNQKVSLKVNGKTYSATTNSKGIATVKTAALAVGTYTVTASFAGNGNYSAKSLSKSVKVLSSVSGNDLTKYYGSSTYFKATLWKDNDKLANTKVTFSIGGKSYTFTTNSKGVATAKVELKPGKYTVTVTNPVSKEKLSKTLVVKKDSTKISGKSKVYILPYNYYTYQVNLTTAHGSPVKNAKVTFTYNGTSVTAKTNSKGKASTVIPLLDKGTYKITYKFSGNSGLSASSSSGTFIIKSADNKLSASDLKMDYKDGSKFTVKFTDNNNKALSGETIRFILNDKEYTAKTDSKGVAKLAIGNLKPGTYKIKYLYSTLGESDYNYGYKNVVINKLTVKLNAGNLVMNYKDGSVYKASVKDSSGNPLKNIKVKFNISGTVYTQKTDSKGVAKLKITKAVGTYTVKSTVSSSYYKSNTLTKKITVNGTKITAKDLYVANGKRVTYAVKLTDANNKPLKSASVKFTVDGKSYTKKTDSTGSASVSLGKLSSGNHKISAVHDGSSKTRVIHVISKVTLKQVISASISVRNYVLSNNKLPSTVTVGNVKITTADYLYLASKAIVNLKSNNKADIALKSIKSPSKAGAAADLGDLSNYLAVAKSVIKTADSKGQMPNSVSSAVGDIGYKGLVFAFARVVAFYGDNNIMPAYVTISTLSDTSSTTSKLNSKNTISNLAAYLAATTNCQVNNSQIKQLVNKLTKGLTSEKAKATAIYNYVRDTISYSFYYDTKYGAVGTLNAKKGNCVDHSHLLVAMFRTAGLAARYAHGTCTFTSGTYGHVWTQVLIGNTWTVCDATSARNSFGNVVNWNANSYSLKGYYASIAF